MIQEVGRYVQAEVSEEERCEQLEAMDTVTLMIAASEKLKLSPKQCMDSAQRLYGNVGGLLPTVSATWKFTGIHLVSTHRCNRLSAELRLPANNGRHFSGPPCRVRGTRQVL